MATLAPDIPRMVFPPIIEEPIVVVDSRKELATKAANLLGYDLLDRAYNQSHTLLYALRELGIAPLNIESVNKYKNSKIKRGIWTSTKRSAFAIIACPIFLLTAATLDAHTKHPTPLSWVMFCILLVGALASFICAIAFGGERGRGEWNTRTVHIWNMQQLSGYTGTVPLFVLSKALEIKEKCPGVRFSVDSLQEVQEHGQKKPVRDPDPFLVARLGQNPDGSDWDRDSDEIYYIDVWDEREYESQML